MRQFIALLSLFVLASPVLSAASQVRTRAQKRELCRHFLAFAAGGTGSETTVEEALEFLTQHGGTPRSRLDSVHSALSHGAVPVALRIQGSDEIWSQFIAPTSARMSLIDVHFQPVIGNLRRSGAFMGCSLAWLITAALKIKFPAHFQQIERATSQPLLWGGIGWLALRAGDWAVMRQFIGPSFDEAFLKELERLLAKEDSQPLHYGGYLHPGFPNRGQLEIQYAVENETPVVMVLAVPAHSQ